SDLTFISGSLKPWVTSSVWNTSTTGSPFFNVISLGLYENFFAVISILRGVSERASGALQTSSKPPSTMMNFLRFIRSFPPYRFRFRFRARGIAESVFHPQRSTLPAHAFAEQQPELHAERCLRADYGIARN